MCSYFSCEIDTDIKLLEDRLDELIVQVASKRNQCPREIQAHVIKTIKAQQNILVSILILSWGGCAEFQTL